MAATQNCDMVMTGHSLGRNKLEHLLATGEALKFPYIYRIEIQINNENFDVLFGSRDDYRTEHDMKNLNFSTYLPGPEETAV